MRRLEKRSLVSERAMQKNRVLLEYEKGAISRSETAKILDLSERQVSRTVKRFRSGGILGLEHGLFDKPSAKATPPETVARIQELIRTKYLCFNFKHFHEMLKVHEQIDISYSSVKRICQDLEITKKIRRKKKVRHLRNRYPRKGFMLQMDGSEHAWIHGKKWVLIGAIDDATSEVPFAEFFDTESLDGYLNVLKKIFKTHGKPRILYVDRASWLSGTGFHEENMQFKRICNELDIVIIFAESPQAKGRIERLWGTFQDRLVAELWFHGIQSMEGASNYLHNQFLPNTWNKNFVVEPKESESEYRVAPTAEGIDETFAYKYKRQVKNDHTILWGNRKYQITKPLNLSLARRDAEIRIYPNGSIKGYYAGQDLELKRIDPRVVDKEPSRPIDPPSHGLRIKLEPQKGNYSINKGS